MAVREESAQMHEEAIQRIREQYEQRLQDQVCKSKRSGGVTECLQEEALNEQFNARVDLLTRFYTAQESMSPASPAMNTRPLENEVRPD